MTNKKHHGAEAHWQKCTGRKDDAQSCDIANGRSDVPAAAITGCWLKPVLVTDS
jgi:hypothetical protein